MHKYSNLVTLESVEAHCHVHRTSLWWLIFYGMCHYHAEASYYKTTIVTIRKCTVSNNTQIYLVIGYVCAEKPLTVPPPAYGTRKCGSKDTFRRLTSACCNKAEFHQTKWYFLTVQIMWENFLCKPEYLFLVDSDVVTLPLRCSACCAFYVLQSCKECPFNYHSNLPVSLIKSAVHW